jgi:UDP-glucose 4-epimerase
LIDLIVRYFLHYYYYFFFKFCIFLDCSCLENLDEVKNFPNYKFVKGNICSSDLVNFVLETEQIDTIMHFAAQTHVDNSFGNSFQFTQNNIMGTHVLLESAKVMGIKRFIHVSTDEVYGEQRRDQEAMSEEQVCLCCFLCLSMIIDCLYIRCSNQRIHMLQPKQVQNF